MAENSRQIENQSNSLDERVRLLDERLKKSQETISSCSEKIKGIKTELEAYSINAKYYFSNSRVNLSQIIDANFLGCAKEVIPAFGFGKSDWGIYVVKAGRDYVSVMPFQSAINHINEVKIRYSEFKNMFPDLVAPLKEKGSLVIAGKFSIDFDEDRPNYMYINSEKAVPSTRIITKEDQEKMRMTLTKRINDCSRQLDENKAKLAEEKKSEDLLKNELEYLNKTLRNAEENAEIRKGLSGLFGKPCYSLWVGESPVLMYSEGNFYYAATNRKDEPLKINMVTFPAAKEHLQKSVNKAQKEASFKEGDFIAYNGMPVNKNNEIYAAELFKKIFQGIEILPRPEEPKGYCEKAQQAGENETEIKYRHWGQVFLSKLSPDEVKQGEVMGSGGSYKSFRFGDKVVVEFDQEERATYLFDTASFDRLRTRNRSELINENPSGFYGRVIHHENRDLWKDGIDGFLKDD